MGLGDLSPLVMMWWPDMLPNPEPLTVVQTHDTQDENKHPEHLSRFYETVVKSPMRGSIWRI